MCPFYARLITVIIDARMRGSHVQNGKVRRRPLRARDNDQSNRRIVNSGERGVAFVVVARGRGIVETKASLGHLYLMVIPHLGFRYAQSTNVTAATCLEYQNL